MLASCNNKILPAQGMDALNQLSYIQKHCLPQLPKQLLMLITKGPMLVIWATACIERL